MSYELDLTARFLHRYNKSIRKLDFRGARGRLFVVGDIHGDLIELNRALDRSGFNRKTDTLFSVGDIIDKGPDSLEIISSVEEGWLIPILGNHEIVAIMATEDDKIDKDDFEWTTNGGSWLEFMNPPPEVVSSFRSTLLSLPIGIELITDYGKFGFLHAQSPSDCDSWEAICEKIDTRDCHSIFEATWGRAEMYRAVDEGINRTIFGANRIFYGHTPTSLPVVSGNQIWLDTHSSIKGGLTIMDLSAFS